MEGNSGSGKIAHPPTSTGVFGGFLAPNNGVHHKNQPLHGKIGPLKIDR